MTEDVSASALRHVPLFADLPAASLAALEQASLRRTYRDGHVLCSEGDPGEMLFVLEAGAARISRVTLDGQEVVFAVVEAPAALGELSLLDGAPRSATVTAQGEIAVRLIPRPAFLALLDEHPAMTQAILRRLAEMLRRANEQQVDLLSLDVPGRLAKWLLHRAERHGARDPNRISFTLGRTQGELAIELGTTRSTLNRALNSFVDLGLIELDGDRVTILDPEALSGYTR
jgi:CRP/FNR family transcriptional regulator, cyclic AMP receptor protein